MACIVFGIADSLSHYNASFKIAKELKRDGHRVVFIGDSNKRSKDVEAQGFKFQLIYNKYFEKAKEIDSIYDTGFIIWSYFKKLINQIKWLREYKDEVLSGREIKKIIEKYHPDLFIIDIFHVFHYPTIYRFGIETIILQTYVNTRKGRNVPPLNSNYIPRTGWKSAVYTELLWCRLFIIRYVLNLWNKIMYFGLDKLTLFKMSARKNNLPLHKIDFLRSFHWGLKNIPELILAAKEFDFEHPSAKNQYYVGPAVEFQRKEILYDERYLEVCLEREIQEVNDRSIVRPIIYCSLGTLNTDWYKSCSEFFEKVIEAFYELKNYELYLSVGPDINVNSFSNVPGHVHIFNLVPQIDVLEKASLMITHGGINSINECIFAGVPMIVYPLSSNIDQNGNAARVLHHQLGIRGDIESENKQGIQQRILHMMDSPVYKNNTDKMKSVYKDYEGKNLFMSIINRCLEKSEKIYGTENV
ncbi:MAG: zeaxanthin glucosyltransferase [Cyclobacteriaceae bacterium]|jgi:zeaxanthin glucosyltransferase